MSIPSPSAITVLDIYREHEILVRKMNERSLFQREEQTVKQAEELLANGPTDAASWAASHQELLSKYKKLLKHAKLLMNVGDIMQKDLNTGNERLRESHEREEYLRTQLIQSQKIEAIGTLAGGIAHDFNNLLTVVLGYAELSLLDLSKEDPLYDNLQKITQSARHGADMVQRLLLFSKKADMNPIRLDLNQTVRSTESLLRHTLSKRIRIETLLADDLHSVVADSAQMEQIIMNLAINAGEAMPDGGKLTLETKNIFLDAEFCATHTGAEPGQYAVMSVSDTGKGMDKNIRERMYNPFFTVKGWNSNKGTGLGLPVVLGIVERHGGFVECVSEVDRGSTFRVFLPMATSETVAVTGSSQPVSLTGKETILLVDDDSFVREIGARLLERSGYTVLTASDGKEALDLYRGKCDDVALVVLDLIMPLMGGEECLRQLVSIDPDVRVIISSGHSDVEDIRTFHTPSVRDVVKKPYDARELLKSVRLALDADQVVSST